VSGCACLHLSVFAVLFACSAGDCAIIMEDEYRLTLVSNSELSSQLYPTNTVAKFTTRLCRPVELDPCGEYEIGLTKIQFPLSFYNINDSEFSVTAFYIDDDGSRTDYEVENLAKGNYSEPRQLIRYLNSLPLVGDNMRLEYNEDSNRVDVVPKPGERRQVNFSPKLREMLGFNPPTIVDDWIFPGLAPKPINMYRNVHRQIFVYCDVVEPQLVGDSMERVLYTVGIPDVSKFGQLFKERYDTPDYIPLLKTHFHTIEINMKTYEDKPAPFEFGPSLVKVHIRRRQRRDSAIVLSAKRRRW
jgi:hypothetical protein